MSDSADLSLGASMTTAVPAGTSKSVAVTVMGLVTLLCGGCYATLGSRLILDGAAWFVQSDPDPWKQLGAWFGLGAVLVIAVGIFFLLLAVPVLLAGLGVLWRKQWGRSLTSIVAVLAILLGLLWVSGVEDVLQDATDLAVGLIQILYGILALVILSLKRAEFSRPRAAANLQGERVDSRGWPGRFGKGS